MELTDRQLIDLSKVLASKFKQSEDEVLALLKSLDDTISMTIGNSFQYRFGNNNFEVRSVVQDFKLTITEL